MLGIRPGGLGDPSRKQERAEPINQEGCCKGDAGVGAAGCHRASRGLSGKESACQCRRHRFDPWVGKIPGGGNGSLLPYSFLDNPMDRGIVVFV